MTHDKQTLEQVVAEACEEICQHFENLKMAESDGGGELWYGELEQIIKNTAQAAIAAYEKAMWRPIESARPNIAIRSHTSYYADCPLCGTTYVVIKGQDLLSCIHCKTIFDLTPPTEEK